MIILKSESRLGAIVESLPRSYEIHGDRCRESGCDASAIVESRPRSCETHGDICRESESLRCRHVEWWLRGRRMTTENGWLSRISQLKSTCIKTTRHKERKAEEPAMVGRVDYDEEACRVRRHVTV